MLIDQSSAFDCVEADILDAKLELYGFAKETRDWVMSYMSGRSQYVMIGAAKSGYRRVHCGDPQGSVLGPIFYLLYMNDLPDVLKEDDCRDSSHKEKNELFGENCTKCGNMVVFADDVTLIVSNKTRQENQKALENKLTQVTEYLTSNSLSINQKKTQLQEFMVKQKQARLTTTSPEIVVRTAEGDKTIKNKMNTRLLGLNLHEDLSWRLHLELGDKPLLPTLRKRLGGLRHIGRKVPEQGRKLLASSLIISKITYMIQVWGGRSPLT